MDAPGSERTCLLEEKASKSLHLNSLSYWSFWWIFKTIRIGYRRPLTPNDVYDIPHVFATKDVTERLGAKLETEGTSRPTSGVAAMFRIVQAFPLETAYLILVYFIGEGVRLSQPCVLGLFLDYLTHDTIPDSLGYTYAALLVLSAAVFFPFILHSFHMAEIYGMRVRSAYGSIIYNKVLRLNSTQHQKVTSGNIINLFSTDLECIYQAIVYEFCAFSSTFNMVVVIVLLYLQLGWSSLVGLAVSGVFLLVCLVCSRECAKRRSRTAEATDCRVQLMNEIISATRVIKMYCWESFFQDTISEARKKEISQILKGNVFNAVSRGSSNASGAVVTAAVLITYYFTGHQLGVSVVFKSMLYCKMIQEVAIYDVPRAIQFTGQASRSLERVEEFLRQTDAQPVLDSHEGETCIEITKGAVSLSEVTASWDTSMSSETKQICHLKNVTLTCERGSLTAVVGPVGAGKTSLLMYMAGEMTPITGRLTKRGEVSYCPQDPWILQDTVQQNILLGLAMDSTRYRQVVDVCGLEKDINEMPYGDHTLIGERGHTLSGGQKARVSLARAVYRKADIYLLDDPLSAVDSKVGRHIFDRCFKTFLSGKTRILVTHQTQYLCDTDQVILILQGSAKCIEPSLGITGIAERLPEDGSQQEESLKKTLPPVPKELLLADKNEEGDVSWAVYFGFIRAGGTLFFILSFFMLVLTAGVATSAAWYLSEWTTSLNRADSQNGNGTTSTDGDQPRLMHIFIGLTTTATFLVFVAQVPLYVFMAAASQNLHDAMFYRVMRAPVQFFDINPVGIVINKFSRDLGFVDLMLPDSLRSFMMQLVMQLCQLGVICLVLPWLVIAAGIMTVLLYALYRFCLRAFMDLKRLEASARSPLYSHVSETLNGHRSIRILKRRTDFITKFHTLQDHHTMCWLMYLTCYRWLGFLLSSALILFLTLVVMLALILKGEVSASLLGLCLTFLFASLEDFESMFRYMAFVENFMTSVERILHYTKLEQEPMVGSGCKPPATWPQAGDIHFKNVSLHYYEGLAPALENLSFRVMPCEKVGIVGRTGSGKSSLLRAMMRLTEPSGSLYIDNINIMDIGVKDLREKISVIPQDPVLFNGTMRQNLDPLGASTDSDLWQALKKAQLFEKVASLNGGLDAEVYQGGANLSMGQRQLVCLARALIKQNKILILDEATANIDRNTDQVIQVAIRVYFRHCTILIIAHRLDTIMDCNRVMVLEQGKLMEYDNPYLLLQNSESLFHQYTQQLGKKGFESALEIAQESYTNRLNT